MLFIFAECSDVVGSSNHFSDFKIIETKLIDEPEEHGDLGKHVHKCRLIIALKI